MYKLIIAGSRTWTNYPQLIEAVKHFNRHYNPGDQVEIVSGTASGADQLGEKLAKEYGVPVCRMPAKWKTHGRSAGYKRNEEMAEYADGCIVLWDGQSKGAKHMMDLAEKHGLELLVVTLKPEEKFIEPVKDDLPWK